MFLVSLFDFFDAMLCLRRTWYKVDGVYEEGMRTEESSSKTNEDFAIGGHPILLEDDAMPSCVVLSCFCLVLFFLSNSYTPASKKQKVTRELYVPIPSPKQSIQ